MLAGLSMFKRLLCIAGLLALGLPLGAKADGTNTIKNRQRGPSSRLTGLIISEIMYHPAVRGDGKDGEFVELFNTLPVDEDIAGFELTGDISYVFPTGAVLQARSYLVVAKDTNAYLSVSNVMGPFTGLLNNGWGVVRLKNPSGALLLDAGYSSEYPWPAGAGGAGHSLTLAKPDYGEGDIRAWSASSRKGGSPGEVDPYSSGSYDGLVINELVTHTDPPLEDSIELFNSSTNFMNISGCWLSDDPDTNKYRIANGTILGPRAFTNFTQTNFVFGLSMAGGSVYLVSSNDDRVIDAVKYSAMSNGASLGRYPDGTAGFQALALRTLGGSNAVPQVGNIVINEIMYHPISGNDDDEYVELYNRGPRPVDVGYWKFVQGIDYVIPPGTMILSSNYLVVAKNVTNLIAKYPQLNVGNTVGDFSGTLSGSGERVVLAKPDDLTLPFQDYVIEDEVTYSSGWGDWTDGGGSSLELRDPHSDNRFGMNWAGSDESQKAPWTIIDYTDALDNGAGSPNPLEIWAVKDGEFIVDDLMMTTASTTNFYDDFESGSVGWIFSGSQMRSSVDANVGYTNSRGLYIRSSDRGEFYGAGVDWFVNHIDKIMLSAPSGGQIARIQAKVRWLRGFPFLVIGTSGSWISTPGDVTVPGNLGSPGLRNSAYTNNAGPAIDDISQNPILPAASSNVVVTCSVRDVDGVASVYLRYRIDPGSTTNSLSMNDNGINGDALAGDGIYSVTLPGQGSGAIAAFVIDAIDGSPSASSSRYPSRVVTGRSSYECYICWGMPQPKGSGGLPTYRAIITQANIAMLDGAQRSREPVSCTCVYEDYRVVFGGDQKNHAGNGRHGFWFLLPGRDRLLGDDQFHIHDSSWIELFHVSTWITESIGEIGGVVRAAPFARNAGGLSLTFEYVMPARDLCTAWFGDSDPEVFKGEDWYLKNDAFGVYTSAYDGAMKKVTYASIDSKRAGGKNPNNDYSQVYKLATTFSTADNSKYVARVKAVVDIRSWAAYFAVAGLTGDNDHYGYWGGSACLHNYYAYIPLNGKSRLMLHDFDFVFSTGPKLNGPELASVPGRLFNDTPTFRRILMSALKDAADGPLKPEVINKWYDDWNAAYASNGLPSGRNIGGDKTYLANSRTAILNVLAAIECPLTIGTGGGSDLSTNVNPVILTGIAPVYAEKICINGNMYDVEYTGLTNWQARVWLGTNANPLTVTAFDHAGNLVGTDTITITYTGPVITPDGKLVINEIMYNPAVPYASFVELYNRSTNTLSLGGLRIDGIDCDIGYGYMIAPNGYAVVVGNIPGYQCAYSNAEVVVGEFSGIMDNGGETLKLLRPDVTGGTTNWIEIDRVTYDDHAPWPVAADGGGPSLQLRDASNDNTRVSNWAADTNVLFTPGMPNSVATNLATFANVWINEIMPTNTGLFADNLGEYEPWVEFYNSGTNNVALGSGYYLSDSYTNLTKWAFPVGVVITNKTYLLVWADGEASESSNGYLHASWRMNSASGSVALVMVSGTQTAIVDYVNYTRLGTNQSYGSSPDGDQFSRQVFHYPTPGTTNNPASDVPMVFINEWMADNTKTADVELKKHDWFELYNASNSPVDLTGFQMAGSSNGTNRCIIPVGASMPGKGFLLVWADSKHTVKMDGGALYVNFGLSKSGDTIWLFTPDGRVVDKVVFGAQLQDISGGRWPDGTTNVYQMPISTPGSRNKLFQDKITLMKSDPGSVLFAPTTAKFIAVIDYTQVTGSVDQVEFWEGPNLLHTSVIVNPVDPCEYTWNANTTGAYYFWARMIGGGGLETNNSSTNIIGVLALANGGASNIMDTAADIYGQLIGGLMADVYICWGRTDKGSDRWQWDNATYVGLIGAGSYSIHATGLTPGMWYYRCFARAGVNEGWAPVTTNFMASYVNWSDKTLISFPWYTGSEILTNFPALVTLRTNMPGFRYSEFTSSDGRDLRFGSYDGVTGLNYEMEKWDTTGTSYVWVQLPELKVGTRIWALWGNTWATNGLPWSAHGSVWGSEYDLVWHMTNSGAYLQDSTTNRVSGVISGAYSNRNGQISTALNLGLDTNRMTRVVIDETDRIALSSEWTISAWYRNLCAKTFVPRALVGGNMGDQQVIMGASVDSVGTMKGASYYAASNALIFRTSVWQHVTAVGRGTNTEFYLNGVYAGQVYYKSTNDIRYLGNASNNNKFAEDLDEFRIERKARSAKWIQSRWMNEASNSVFTANSVALPTGLGDANSNGVPDWWEVVYFGATNVSGGTGGADHDYDGFTDYSEWVAGTDPTNPVSLLKLTVITMNGESVLRFDVVPVSGEGYLGKSRYYDLQVSTNLIQQGGAWTGLVDMIDIPAGNRTESYTNVQTAPVRLYRVRARLEP